MAKYSDKKIIESWQVNATPWVEAVESGAIESRQLVTNQAIIETLVSLPVKNIVDIGCGEGWLVRALCSRGLSVLGIDVVEALIARAQAQGVGQYKHLAYEALSRETLAGQYDAAVCNFSLIGEDSVEHLFKTLPTILSDSGYLVIQTLHPEASCGDLPYEDGWREGSWQGFSEKFSQPAPWYFRTLDTWKSLFHDNGFDLQSLIEPVHPTVKNKLSIIFVGKKK